jgi:dihydrofolate synthase/folylpolyglutamate synthase
MNFDQAFSYLLSLGHETLTIKLGLQNTETLLHALGNPEKTFPAVQIAGTNGKGSTAAFLDSICRWGGVRTGLFTSPHLISITERIKVNGEQIARDEFARVTAEVKSAADKLVASGQLQTLPTFFEHITAIALVALRDAKVELAILETGLGGRLDSTTAAGADLVAITPIAMDHEEYLGHSLAEIAAEKAAIIRPGVTAVIAPQEEGALEVILRQCKASEVDPILIQSGASARLALPARYRQRSRNATRDGRCIVTFETDHDVYENITLGLRGRHQTANALTAIALAEALRKRGITIPHAAIVRGVETATHPGRLELWQGPPRMLFDGAHNPAAARALREYLDEFVKEPIVMIFGAMRDKALDEMAAALFPRADAVILTELDNPRAASIDALTAALPDNFDQVRKFQSANVDDALGLIQKIAPANALVCVTGSLYLVGAVQQIIKPEEQSAVGPHVAHKRAPN